MKRPTAVGALFLLLAPTGLLLAAADGPAAADPTSLLGGFQVSSSGAGIRTTYEQPNLPVPATPSLEASLGFATTSFDSGPTGESTASTLWPGQVVAGAGPQLPAFYDSYLQPYLGNNTPQLTAGPWPLQATSAFPQGPQSGNQDSGEATMEADSTAASGTATANFGPPASGGAAALPSGFVSVKSLGSSVEGTVDGQGRAVAQASSAVHGISVAGGLINIGTVTSTATAQSDGTTGAVTGTSVISGVTVAGQAVTVDAQGVHASGQTLPVLGALLPTVSQVLQTAGITLTLTAPTDTVKGAGAERVLQGLQITVNLDTLDSGMTQLQALLPIQVRQQILSQLPVPTPNRQTLQMSFGWLDVSATASPVVSFDAGSATAGAGGSTGDAGLTTPLSTDLGGTGTGGTDGTSAIPGTAGTSGDPGTGTVGTSGTPTAGTTPAGGTALPATTAAAVPVLFKGIGSGLIILGLLFSAGLAWLLLRTDRAAGALAGPGSSCPREGTR